MSIIENRQMFAGQTRGNGRCSLPLPRNKQTLLMLYVNGC